MPRLRHLLPLSCAAIAAACASYEPRPVDLAAYARDYGERLPDLDAIRAFAKSLGSDVAGEALTRTEARALALWFHPDLQRARAAAGVALAVAENSGYWPDPTIQGSAANKLGNQNPWLVTSAIGLTVPLSGQFGLQAQLADERHGSARLSALVREVEVRDGLDADWVRWSALTLRATALRELCGKLAELDRIGSRLLASNQLSRPEARLFSLELASRRAELAAAEAESAVALSRLHETMGLPPGSTVPLQPELDVASRADEAMDAAPIVAGPRLVAAHRLHVEAERQLELAISRQWPTLSLFPGWEEEDAVQRPALGFSVPIPLWNRNRLAIAEATAQRDAAESELRAAFEEAAQERARAATLRAAATERRRLLANELVPSCRDQLEDATRLVELGELDPLLLLDAVTRLYEAHRDALLATVDEAAATAQENSFYWPEGCDPIAVGAAPPREESR